MCLCDIPPHFVRLASCFDQFSKIYTYCRLPWWLSSEESARNAEVAGSIPRSGRSPGGGHGDPLYHFCWENPMDRGAWWATAHGVNKESEMSDYTCLEV